MSRIDEQAVLQALRKIGGKGTAAQVADAMGIGRHDNVARSSVVALPQGAMSRGVVRWDRSPTGTQLCSL